MRENAAVRGLRRGITTVQTVGSLVLLLVLVCVGMVLGKCSFGPGELPTAMAVNNPAAAVFIPTGSNILTVLNTMGWAGVESPLYTDDQRFLGNGGVYGHHARIFPSVALDTLTEAGMGQPAGTAGVLVAIMEVLPDPTMPSLHDTYKDMDVSLGVNCVYIRSGAPWRAYMGPPNGAGGCDYSYSDATALNVKVDTFPSAPPSVARFHEGQNANRGITEGAPYIGVRCGIAWCSIHNPDVTPVAPAQTGDDDTSTPYSVPGWGDAQHLAVPPATSGPLSRSDQHAYVVPVVNFSSITLDQFKQDYQHVANVIFKVGPDGKYSNTKKWGFEIKTDNKIFLTTDATGTHWKAKVIRRTYIFGAPMPYEREFHRKVDREAHPGMRIPHTVRFRWDANDEDLWVRCDDGCCKVSPS